MVYHGTQNNFSVFHDTGRTDSGWYGKGFYFTEDKKAADSYSKMYAKSGDEDNTPSIIPAFINMRKPLVQDVKNAREDDFLMTDDAQAAIDRNKYDGVIIWKNGTMDEVMVQASAQIKSSIGNTGVFSPDHPDIRYSFGQHSNKNPTRNNIMNNEYPDPSYDDVRTALSYVDVPESYNEWYPYAFAIKDAVGDTGFDLWDEWFRRGSNYDSAQSKATWKSARPSPGGITAATLFKAARANGYRPDKTIQPLTAEQAAQSEARVKAQAEQAAKELAKQHAQAAKTAYGIWHNAEKTVDLSHNYLQKKGIADAELVRNIRQNEYKGQKQLVIPLWQDGKITSVQTINENSGKHFLKGGQKSGSYAFIGSQRDMGKGVALAEGFATAASIHKATGRPVFIAFDSGNLAKVAEKLAARQDIPHVVIAADNDISGSGQKGAREALAKLNSKGSIVMPEFTPETIAQYQAEHGRIDNSGKENLPSDFNDLHKLAGIKAVRKAFSATLDRKEKEMTPEKPLSADILNRDEEQERILADQQMLNNEKAAGRTKYTPLETFPHSPGEGLSQGQTTPATTPETAAPEAAVIATGQEGHVVQGTDSKQLHSEQTGQVSTESPEYAEDEKDMAENEARLKAAAITTAASAALPGMEGASLATDAAVFAAQEVVDEKLADKIQELEGKQTAGKQEKQAATLPENTIEYDNIREIRQKAEEPEIIDAEESLANLREKQAAEQKSEPSVRLPQTPPTEPATLAGKPEIIDVEEALANLRKKHTAEQKSEPSARLPQTPPTEPVKSAAADSAKPAGSPDKETESLTPPKPKPVLDLNYATASGLNKRYVRVEGRYLDLNNTQTVMFEDKGGKIKTAKNDPQTISDMLDTAQAKNWDSIRISGSHDFKKQMWLEAELRGIPSTGYKPGKEDLALRDQMREMRERNSIEPVRNPEITAERVHTAHTQKPDRVAEMDDVAVKRQSLRENVPDPTGRGKPASEIHQAMEAAKLSYLSKAGNLSDVVKAQMIRHERDFADIASGLPPKNRDMAMLHFYTSMQQRMNGTKLDMPLPEASGRQQGNSSDRSPTHDDMDMER